MTNNQPFDLELQLYSLLKDEPFFASLSRRINKSKTTAIPTAGVRVNPRTGRYEICLLYTSPSPRDRG